MTNLFNYNSKGFQLHSGDTNCFKIDCDALTNDDLQALADYIGPSLYFSDVYGIPRGGERFAKKLRPYAQEMTRGVVLLVDDVLTTGKSMEEARNSIETNYGIVCTGLVIFARGKCPNWIEAIFQL